MSRKQSIPTTFQLQKETLFQKLARERKQVQERRMRILRSILDNQHGILGGISSALEEEKSKGKVIDSGEPRVEEHNRRVVSL